MKTSGTLYTGLLLAMVASLAVTAPLPDKRTDHIATLSDQAGDVPYYCDEYPEALPCSLFCRASNWQYEYCHPEYCESHPEHWSCKPKYIEEETEPPATSAPSQS